MHPSSLPPPPRLPALTRGKKWPKALVLVALLVALGLYTWPRQTNKSDAGAVPPPTPPADWVGVWFAADQPGGLPMLELLPNGKGRIIVADRAGPDRGVSLEEIADAGENRLEFVTRTDGARVKYCLSRTDADGGELATIADPAYELGAYLGPKAGTGGSAHTPAQREKLLEQLRNPPAPVPVARMTRTAVRPARSAAFSDPQRPGVSSDAQLKKGAR